MENLQKIIVINDNNIFDCTLARKNKCAGKFKRPPLLSNFIRITNPKPQKDANRVNRVAAAPQGFASLSTNVADISNATRITVVSI